MIEVYTVYRYESSGKLIAAIGGGDYIPLSGNLTFLGKGSHKVNYKTVLRRTPYKIEVEVDNGHLKILQTWDESRFPQKSSDPNAPLEYRINICPSQVLNEAEKKYVGHSTGHPFGFGLLWVSLILLFGVGDWGWWPVVAAVSLGLIIIFDTKTPGSPTLIRLVMEAKSRLRHSLESKMLQSMSDISWWSKLSGIEFEHAVATIYQEQGFSIEFTPQTNDQGVDLILRRNNEVSIVQCKRYAGSVGVAAIRELVGVRASWPEAKDAILATLYDFSSGAQTFATKHNITLFSVAKDYLKTNFRA